MNNLRSKLIRLAYRNPELRKDLLPLLKTAAPHPTFEAEASSVIDSVASILADKIRAGLLDDFGKFIIQNKKTLSRPENDLGENNQMVEATLHGDDSMGNTVIVHLVITGPYVQRPEALAQIELVSVDQDPDGGKFDVKKSELVVQIKGSKIGLTETEVKGLSGKGKVIADEIYKAISKEQFFSIAED